MHPFKIVYKKDHTLCRLLPPLSWFFPPLSAIEVMLGEAHWLKPPTLARPMVTIFMSFMTGGPGKEHGTNKPPPTGRVQERSRGETRCQTTSQNPSLWHPSWLNKACTSRKDSESDVWLKTTLGFIPGSGRSAGEGNGNPLQYSCQENPMDWEAWWATVQGVAKSRARLSDFAYFTYSREGGSLAGFWVPGWEGCRRKINSTCRVEYNLMRTELHACMFVCTGGGMWRRLLAEMH